VWQQFNESTLISVIQNARLWALRLVHSLNLAMYFGILEEFLGVTNLPLRRPSIASFLEILHPDQPGCSSPETAESITNCCRAILDPKHRLKNPSNDLIKVAINLPVTNMVACCADSGSLFPIPAIISRLLPIDDDTNKKSGSDTEKPYRVIDFIEFYLSNVNNRDHKIVLWDHLTSQSGDREHRRPIEDRFFVPISEPLSGIMAPCRWQLTDRGVQLNLQKMDPDDIGKAAKAIPGGYPAIRSSIPKVDAELELAYHLYPREQWAGVRTAWGMARALRSQPEVEIIPSSKRKSVRHKSANARTSHTPTGAISSKIHENLDSGNHKYD
jgi:hypothetical protein